MAAAALASSARAAPSTPPANSVAAGPYVVTAVGERDGEVLHVQRLVVRRAEATGVVQTLDGLATDTPWPPDAPGLEALDMNFDGHPDLRLIEFRAAGPNTPWRHWMFDPAADQFVASPALDALSPTRFDAQRQQVVVDWRDGAARSGSDVYTWQQGQLRRISVPH
ncbi:MAG: hypothetical protein H6933_06295 [Burkholderiaceae bacterium]|nr:hypothetical protein [Rhodoferax sp.]MCP5284490.1 hypothetical protein [Burkholderiaceae bacterium]